jgi:alpha-D-ribose 1-methylphosphonate 5-triphosphate synthase subunit PhnG
VHNPDMDFSSSVSNAPPSTELLRTPRQRWMRDLSLAQRSGLAEDVQQFISERNIAVSSVKGPEVGLCMVPAQVSGVGESFGLGEVTVTRCIVDVRGDIGVGYVLGRDHSHAYYAAIGDALLQGRWSMSFEADVLQPIRQVRQEAELTRAGEVDLTRVNFDTMVRAEG